MSFSFVGEDNVLTIMEDITLIGANAITARPTEDDISGTVSNINHVITGTSIDKIKTSSGIDSVVPGITVERIVTDSSE